MAISNKHILYSGPIPDNYINEYKSLGEMCLNRLQDADDLVLLEHALTTKTVKGSDLRSRTIRLAQRLKMYGIKKGDTIGICCENCSEFVYVMFASFCLGVTFTPINVMYTESELSHVVNLSKPRIMFVSPQSLAKVIKVTEVNTFIERIVVFGDQSKHNDIVDYNSFVNEFVVQEPNHFMAKPQNLVNNVALILYSSGTTGLSKGVQLTESNIMNNFAQHKFSGAFELQPEAVVLAVLPWYHSYGCLRLIGRIFSSVRTIFLSRFHEEDFLRSIQIYKINSVSLVPSLLVFLAKSPLVDQYDLSSLKSIHCGGASLRKELLENIKKRIGVQSIRQGYGMTEGTAGFTIHNNDFHQSGSVGTLRSGIWGKVVDIKTGINLGPNIPGEMVFKGVTNMKGYVGDPRATENIIDKDGWIHSGDIGYYDENGEWYIVDRMKDLIKYKGFQVAPAELESIILRHPKVLDVGVVGLPDDEAGELPLAFVVKQPNEVLKAEEIIDYVAALVSPHKRLRGGVRIINEIPVNGSKKILRRELRKMLEYQKSKL